MNSGDHPTDIEKLSGHDLYDHLRRVIERNASRAAHTRQLAARTLALLPRALLAEAEH